MSFPPRFISGIDRHVSILGLIELPRTLFRVLLLFLVLSTIYKTRRNNTTRTTDATSGRGGTARHVYWMVVDGWVVGWSSSCPAHW